jgi:cytochrome c oxidase subunit II
MKSLSASIAVALLATFTLASSVAAAPRKLRVEGKKWEWIPAEVKLKVGEPVEITFVSLDVKHGVSCREVGLAATPFDRERPAVVRFTPTQAGTFPFKCSHLCGKGHRKMLGKFIVEP